MNSFSLKILLLSFICPILLSANEAITESPTNPGLKLVIDRISRSNQTILPSATKIQSKMPFGYSLTSFISEDVIADYEKNQELCILNFAKGITEQVFDDLKDNYKNFKENKEKSLSSQKINLIKNQMGEYSVIVEFPVKDAMVVIRFESEAEDIMSFRPVDEFNSLRLNTDQKSLMALNTPQIKEDIRCNFQRVVKNDLFVVMNDSKYQQVVRVELVKENIVRHDHLLVYYQKL